MAGRILQQCGNQLNSWDARLSKTLAYRFPCCESCIAVEYDMTADELRTTWRTISAYGPVWGYDGMESDSIRIFFKWLHQSF